MSKLARLYNSLREFKSEGYTIQEIEEDILCFHCKTVADIGDIDIEQALEYLKS